MLTTDLQISNLQNLFSPNPFLDLSFKIQTVNRVEHCQIRSPHYFPTAIFLEVMSDLGTFTLLSQEIESQRDFEQHHSFTIKNPKSLITHHLSIQTETSDLMAQIFEKMKTYKSVGQRSYRLNIKVNDPLSDIKEKLFLQTGNSQLLTLFLLTLHSSYSTEITLIDRRDIEEVTDQTLLEWDRGLKVITTSKRMENTMKRFKTLHRIFKENFNDTALHELADLAVKLPKKKRKIRTYLPYHQS